MKSENYKYLAVGILVGLAVIFLLGSGGDQSARYQISTQIDAYGGFYVSVYDTKTNILKCKDLVNGEAFRPAGVNLQAIGLIE